MRLYEKVPAVKRVLATRLPTRVRDH